MGREEGEVVEIFPGGLLRPSSSITHLRRIPFLPRRITGLDKVKLRRRESLERQPHHYCLLHPIPCIPMCRYIIAWIQ